MGSLTTIDYVMMAAGVVVVVIGIYAAQWIRKKFRADIDGHSASGGVSLLDLKDQLNRGEITQVEYDSIKAAFLSQHKATLGDGSNPIREARLGRGSKPE